MCNCYVHKCAGCGKGVEMHLGDFDTEPEEIMVWCPKCTDKKFEYFSGDLTTALVRREDKDGLNIEFVAIRALTRNAFLMQDGNHPNYGGFNIWQSAKSWGNKKKTYMPRTERQYRQAMRRRA